MLSKNDLPQQKKFQFGVVTCSPHTIRQLLGEVRRLLTDPTLSPRTILCVNAHIYNLACHDSRLRDALTSSRMTLADGMAIVWAARLLGQEMAERCNMTEGYHAFLDDTKMPASRAILVGCSQAEAEAAAAKANRTSRHCRIIEAYSGYLSDSEYREILSRHPEIDFIFLGMGTPKTELMAGLASTICPRGIVWGIGGGTIRIEAGTMKEAPERWRRLGLQWAHRLCHEPLTLGRRYLIGNPLFVWRMLKWALVKRAGRKFPTA
jgi:exopolysaccharide biosynthesis WecB/TagA/CpsF family protein